MNPQQSPYTFDTYAPRNSEPDPTKKLIKFLFLVLLGILAIYAVTTVVSAYITSRTTGILKITAPTGATVTVSQYGTTTQTVGTGDVSVHLKPGEYQVKAVQGNQATSAIVNVQKQQTTSQQLALSKDIPNQTVGNYSAQDLYASSDNSLYFVNIPQTVLYTYPLGSASGRPYQTNINPITQAYWISPTKFYGQVGGTWSYYDGSNKTPVGYQNEPYVPNSLSFNSNGMAAFAANSSPIVSDILLISQPGAAPQKIGSIQDINTSTTTAQTSVAPDGSVAVFTPVSSVGAPSKPTQIFKNGTVTTLPKSLAGIQNVSWSTDSSKFSYTTNAGIFIYDFSSHSNTQVFAGNPTDPQSVTWVSADTLIYPDSNAIWRYQLGSNMSKELMGFDGILNVTNPFAIAQDGQTFYFSTVPDSKGKGGKIYQFFPNYDHLPATQQQQANNAQVSTVKPVNTSYSGTDDLLNIGVSADQLTSMQYAFGQYFTQSKQSVNQVVITNVQAMWRDPNSASTVNSATFDAAVNGTPHHCRIDYSGLSAVRLYVYNADGSQQQYDSGTIDTQQ